MTSDKRIQSGNEGEELEPGKTENLSSSLHSPGDAALPRDTLDRDGDERGRRASFDQKTGAVSGSGADAGGGGTPGEDYDQDSSGGSTKPPTQPGR
jgi:hypothetical protein